MPSGGSLEESPPCSTFKHILLLSELQFFYRDSWGFLTTASGLLISQLSLIVTVVFPSIDLEQFYGQLIKNFEIEG